MIKNEAVKFYDTTDWQTLSWIHSGGTREKRVLQDFDDSEWYFKRSEKKQGRDGKPDKYYKDEFWSEVIAYQIGALLGLDILRYDVALSKNQIGCISPSMIPFEKKQLVEVGRYMVTFQPQFSPEQNETRKEYTYQLLNETLNHFGLEKYHSQFIQTLLFDAIIGNSDRHQENWAFISDSFIPLEEIDINPMIARAQIQKELYSEEIISQEIELRKLSLEKMAPIYDSGSSLGRELTEERVGKMLRHPEMIEKYIDKGTSELHWSNKAKVSHLQLIKSLKGTESIEIIKSASLFLNNWNEEKIAEIIETIDEQLPTEFSFYKISPQRKELMYKLVTLRFNSINSIIND